MKVFEMLKLGAETLKTMSRYGIYVDDFRYLEAYESFKRLRCHGMKYECAITEVAREMKVAKRTIQRAFKRLSKEC